MLCAKGIHSGIAAMLCGRCLSPHASVVVALLLLVAGVIRNWARVYTSSVVEFPSRLLGSYSVWNRFGIANFKLGAIVTASSLRQGIYLRAWAIAGFISSMC